MVALMHNIVSEPQPTLSDTPVVASHKKAVGIMSRILGQNIRGFIGEIRPAYASHNQALTHNIIQQIFGVDFIGAGSANDDEDDDDDEEDST